MRDKILKLIHLEVANMSDKNIFRRYVWASVHVFPDSPKSYLEINPVNSERLMTSSSDLHLFKGEEWFDKLDFTLLFDDGEPSIRVLDESQHMSTVETFRKRKYFFGYIGEKMYDRNYFYTPQCVVSCGLEVFTLTSEERNELLKAVKLAYAKYLDLKEKSRLLELEETQKGYNQKINNRLAKYEKN